VSENITRPSDILHFVLLVFVGFGDARKLVSEDMFFEALKPATITLGKSSGVTASGLFKKTGD